MFTRCVRVVELDFARWFGIKSYLVIADCRSISGSLESLVADVAESVDVTIENLVTGFWAEVGEQSSNIVVNIAGILSDK